MVYISVVQDEYYIILNCHKGSEEGEYFRLVIDPVTKRVIEKPDEPDINVSAAYSHIYMLLSSGEPLPNKTIAAWG